MTTRAGQFKIVSRREQPDHYMYDIFEIKTQSSYGKESIMDDQSGDITLYPKGKLYSTYSKCMEMKYCFHIPHRCIF
jgi:hypothetical protein